MSFRDGTSHRQEYIRHLAHTAVCSRQRCVPSWPVLIPGLQYNIHIGSITNTFLSIGTVFQYYFYFCIGIANTYIGYRYCQLVHHLEFPVFYCLRPKVQVIRIVHV